LSAGFFFTADFLADFFGIIFLATFFTFRMADFAPLFVACRVGHHIGHLFKYRLVGFLVTMRGRPQAR